MELDICMYIWLGSGIGEPLSCSWGYLQLGLGLDLAAGQRGKASRVSVYLIAIDFS